jgi:hypothetical protein
MKNQVAFIIFVFFGFSFLMHVFPFIFVEAAKLESGVTISAPSTNETSPPGTCGLQIMTGTPINYGQLNAGQVSDEQKVTIKNVGTAPAQIMVKAGDWIGGTSANPIKMIGPEITRVAVTPGKEFGTKFALHSSEATVLSDLGPGQEQDSFWSVYGDSKLSGSPHQEVSIDLICSGTLTDPKNALTKGQSEITTGDEFLQHSETTDDNNDDDTIAKNPNNPNPIPIPYPNTNNTTKDANEDKPEAKGEEESEEQSTFTCMSDNVDTPTKANCTITYGGVSTSYDCNADATTKLWSCVKETAKTGTDKSTFQYAMTAKSRDALKQIIQNMR